MNGLPREKGETDAEQHDGDADGDIVDPRQAAHGGVQGAQQHARKPRNEHAKPGRAGQIGHAVAAHRAHDQRALKPEVDAPGTLGEALAQTHQQEWGADADGTG